MQFTVFCLVFLLSFLTATVKLTSIQPSPTNQSNTFQTIQSKSTTKNSQSIDNQAIKYLKKAEKISKTKINRFGLTVGNWSFINDGLACSGNFPGNCMQARHEAAYVQAGNRFYLLGGRETPNHVNIYNPATDEWTLGAIPPIPLHHFQAVNYDGLIYVIGGFTGNFPSEPPLTNIYIYNPLKDNWLVGPSVPSARRRGAAGAVVYNDKIYVVSGNILGHKGRTPSGDPTHVSWFDEFDPVSNTWTVLPDAPRARDHFQVAVINNKLYAVAGRRSNHLSNDFQQTFANTEAKVDVYDFNTQTWATLTNDLPTERAGNAVAVLGNELLVMGGESLAQTAAHNQNEALNVNNGTWRTLDPLQHGRHGTQAIINNNGVYIAAGSHRRGGGERLSQERFFLGSSTLPSLSPLTAAQLSPNTNQVNFGQVFNGQTQEQTITISSQNGNQGILIQSINLEASSHPDFDLDIPFSLPIHLRPGGSLNFKARVVSSGNLLRNGSLNIEHSGANANVQIDLATQTTPLAVGMLNLKTQRINPQIVKLNWTTAWERENKGFVIERSENGSDYTQIGFMDGRGTQNQPQEYQFIDNSAPASYYYRLKQLDWSGTFEYSLPQWVESSSPLTFRVFPNPSQGQVQIEVAEDWDKNALIKWQISDNQGLTLQQGEDNLAGLLNHLQAFSQSQTSQVVYLQILAGKKIIQQKIIFR
jgi:N-acetylneuraminic acid mutarotase